MLMIKRPCSIDRLPEADNEATKWKTSPHPVRSQSLLNFSASKESQLKSHLAGSEFLRTVLRGGLSSDALELGYIRKLSRRNGKRREEDDRLEHG